MDDFENLLNKVTTEIPVIELPLEQDTGYTGLYRNNRSYLDKNKSSRKNLLGNWQYKRTSAKYWRNNLWWTT